MWIFARPAVDHTSYTLWYRYLNERCKAVARLSPIDPARKEVNHVFERALVFMHKVFFRSGLYAQVLFFPYHCASSAKHFSLVERNLSNRLMLWMQMPRIWITFLEFVLVQRVITYARRLFDSALKALAITQHHRIWPIYLKVKIARF